MSEIIYEPAKDTAAKIRKALKKSFPSVKFSVTTSVYSGGSSVDIHWADGPMQKTVEAVTDQFESGHFDSMEDLYRNSSYTYEGKQYSGAKYISCSRKMSKERREMLERECAAYYVGFDPDTHQAYSQIRDMEARLFPVNEPAETITAEQPQTQEPEPKQPEPQTLPSNVVVFDVNSQATSRQLWALHCIFKVDTRQWVITKAQASEIISKSKAGQPVTIPQCL